MVKAVKTQGVTLNDCIDRCLYYQKQINSMPAYIRRIADSGRDSVKWFLFNLTLRKYWHDKKIKEYYEIAEKGWVKKEDVEMRSEYYAPVVIYRDIMSLMSLLEYYARKADSEDVDVFGWNEGMIDKLIRTIHCYLRFAYHGDTHARYYRNIPGQVTNTPIEPKARFSLLWFIWKETGAVQPHYWSPALTREQVIEGVRKYGAKFLEDNWGKRVNLEEGLKPELPPQRPVDFIKPPPFDARYKTTNCYALT